MYDYGMRNALVVCLIIGCLLGIAGLKGCVWLRDHVHISVSTK